MKVAWVDLGEVMAAVFREVPRADYYSLAHSKPYPGVEFRIGDDGKTANHRFCVNVFANGEVLGAWPCRTKTQRRLLRTVLDELDRQHDT